MYEVIKSEKLRYLAILWSRKNQLLFCGYTDACRCYFNASLNFYSTWRQWAAAWFDHFPAGKEPSVAIGQVKVKVELTLQQATKALRESRGMALLFLKLRCWMKVGGQSHTRAALPLERDPAPILQEAGRAPGSAWTGAVNFAPIGILSQDRPGRCESQYRLRSTVQDQPQKQTKRPGAQECCRSRSRSSCMHCNIRFNLSRPRRYFNIFKLFITFRSLNKLISEVQETLRQKNNENNSASIDPLLLGE